MVRIPKQVGFSYGPGMPFPCKAQRLSPKPFPCQAPDCKLRQLDRLGISFRLRWVQKPPPQNPLSATTETSTLHCLSPKPQILFLL